MKIVIASDGQLKSIVEFNLHKIEELDYKSLVYNLGGLGIGKPFFGTRPQIIKDALADMDNQELLIYLDGDVVLNNRIEEIRNDGFNVGLIGTFNGKRTTQIKSEIIFLRKSMDTFDFLKNWDAEPDFTLENFKNNQQFSIKYFDKTIYGFDGFPDFPPIEARFLHFKTDVRREFYRRYLKSF